MINLLPDEHKNQIRAGRTNVLLLRYIGMLVSAIVVLSGLVVGSYVVLNTSRESALAKVSDNNQQVTEYTKIRDEAEQFRSDLATAKTIMDNEVTYSKLIYKIADVVPSGVVLDSLELDSAKLGSSATMSASAKTYNDAVALKNAFIKDENLFSDVSFETLSYTDEGGGSYPIKVSLSVTIRKEAL